MPLSKYHVDEVLSENVTPKVFDVHVASEDGRHIVMIAFMESVQTNGKVFWKVEYDERRRLSKDLSTLKDIARDYARKETGWELVES